MAWGDVPGIQSESSTGAHTRNGFAVIKEQASYYTIISVGGMALDFYFLGFSKSAWTACLGTPENNQRDPE